MQDDELHAAWDTSLGRHRDLDVCAARLNVSLLEQLRLHWERTVRPDTSMLTLLFT